MTNDALGARMKMYEARETDRRAMPRLPLYARIDGRSFSRFTADFKKPFDEDFATCMLETTKYLAHEFGSIIAFTQSDEINLAWVPNKPERDLPCAGRLFKLTSLLASTATIKFNQLASEYWFETCDEFLPTFDCRVFTLPTVDELANLFLWRVFDATKNAVNAASSQVFSTSELHGKSNYERIGMLADKGIIFSDYPPTFRRGAFIRNGKILRVPLFSKVTNRPDFILGADPLQEEQEDDLQPA